MVYVRRESYRRDEPQTRAAAYYIDLLFGPIVGNTKEPESLAWDFCRLTSGVSHGRPILTITRGTPSHLTAPVTLLIYYWSRRNHIGMVGIASEGISYCSISYCSIPYCSTVKVRGVDRLCQKFGEVIDQKHRFIACSGYC